MNDRHINVDELMEEFSQIAIQDEIGGSTIGEAYVNIIRNSYHELECPFGIAIEDSRIFNEANDIVGKHDRGVATRVDSMFLMASAYSVRGCSFAGMFTGSVVRKVADTYINLMFPYSQKVTFNNKEFHHFSAELSDKLIESIEPKINMEGFHKFVACCIKEGDKIKFPADEYNFIELNKLLDYFNHLAGRNRISSPEINEFVCEVEKPNMLVRKQLFGENWEVTGEKERKSILKRLFNFRADKKTVT